MAYYKQQKVNAYEAREQRDYEWFAPRFRAVMTQKGCSILAMKRTHKYDRWDVEALVKCPSGKQILYLIELKDRGSDGYTLEQLRGKGTIYMDWSKTQKVKERLDVLNRQCEARGLYAWMFPPDKTMLMGNWMTLYAAGRTIYRKVNRNTLRSTTEKEEEEIVEVPFHAVGMEEYKFN